MQSKNSPAQNAGGLYENQNLKRETILFLLPDFFFIFLCAILIKR
jgi:hypothetical protein